MEPKNREIRCCFFDMGNVLVYFSHELMHEQIGKLCNRTGDEVSELMNKSRLLIKMEVGKLTEEEFHLELQNLVSQEILYDELKIASNDIFKLNHDIVPLIKELKRMKIRLIVLSNTGKSHFEFIREKFKILGLFDDYTLSYQVGAMKPMATIYQDAVMKSGCQPEECFYTDDISAYIDSARDLGIQSVQFQNADQLRKAMRNRGIPLSE
jgi:glucose-1-phosphatase